MGDRLADDYGSIGARLRALEEKREFVGEREICPECEGCGWIAYGIGVGDPHFRECDACHNPEDLPRP